MLITCIVSIFENIHVGITPILQFLLSPDAVRASSHSAEIYVIL